MQARKEIKYRHRKNTIQTRKEIKYRDGIKYNTDTERNTIQEQEEIQYRHRKKLGTRNSLFDL